MKPIEDLKMEHEAVKITLRVLGSICNEAEKTSELAKTEHLEQLIDFFTTFVDRCHHSKEEELLFPALEAVGVSREGGPIGVMLKEHQQGRDHVAKMKADLVRYRDGDRTAAGDLVHHARAYIALLNRHIDKENNVLFVLADKHLSEDKQMALREGFEAIETQKIGPGRHDTFHQMIASLEGIYLS